MEHRRERASAMVRIFFIGDIIGRVGRKLVSQFLPTLQFERQIDFTIANAENAAGGRGVTGAVAAELYKAGVNALTTGNHVWRNRDIYKIIDEDPRVLRPANFPDDPSVPGHGYDLYEIPGTPYSIGIVNLQGLVFMPALDCPFRVGRHAVETLHEQTPLVFVDFHAEATSEKAAMLWHLDGLATAVIGTHTHIPTADEMVTPDGTAFQSDAGMSGPYDSVLGVRKEIILHGMLTHMPVRHELASGDPRLCGVLIDADPETGRALAIERICLRPGDAKGD
jgi:2',3'-cyclic-nucleotide 2'-phosphodiesterase